MKTKSGKPMRICFDRIIPATMPEARHLARRHDIHLARLGAPNAREVLADIDPDAPGPIGGRRMALINSRKWDNGSTLRCRFLEGSKKQQEAVIRHAKEWMKYANINIEFVKSGAAEVRIAFKDDGSWSAIGRDALVESYFPKHGSTMNFGWIFDNTADAVSRAVVLHEFGHALGCIHEHQSPKQTLKWNKQKVYEVFSGSPNYWSKEEIDSNVLQKYSAKGTSATIFDPDSIMLYQFDAELFTNGKATHENTELSALDIKMIGEMYPGVKPPKAAAAAGRRGVARMAAPMAAAAADACTTVVRFFWSQAPGQVCEEVGDETSAGWTARVLRLRMHQVLHAAHSRSSSTARGKQVKTECRALMDACEKSGARFEPEVDSARARAVIEAVLVQPGSSVDDVVDAVEVCYDFEEAGIDQGLDVVCARRGGTRVGEAKPPQPGGGRRKAMAPKGKGGMPIDIVISVLDKCGYTDPRDLGGAKSDSPLTKWFKRLAKEGDEMHFPGGGAVEIIAGTLNDRLGLELDPDELIAGDYPTPQDIADLA